MLARHDGRMRAVDWQPSRVPGGAFRSHALDLRRCEVFGWHVFQRKPRERCVLITTRSASSGVPRSILAHREGHARGGKRSALPGKPNWNKLSFRNDPPGECRIYASSGEFGIIYEAGGYLRNIDQSRLTALEIVTKPHGK
jgi:hypothetical protein